MWATFVALFREAFAKAAAAPTRFTKIDEANDPDERLAAAGRAAVDEAERLFALDVYDPAKTDKSERADASREVIQSIVNDAGWTWIKYTGNGATQWCGMFAAACWRKAGINPSMLATFWASTKRLFAWAYYKPWNKTPNPKPKQGPFRLAADLRKSKTLPFTPRAGDILVIGDGNPAEGDHICVIVDFDGKAFSTIEGNGVGLGPDGKKREGIVRGVRPLSSAMFVYRPGLADLIV